MRSAFPRTSLCILLGCTVLVSACRPPPVETREAVLVADRDALTFAEVRLGQASDAQGLTVRNTSSWAARADAVRLEGEGFSLDSGTCAQALAPGSECTVQVRFVPGLAGPTEARLHLGEGPEATTVLLQGTGVGELRVTALPASGGAVASGSGAEAWSCGEPCTRLVRQPEVVLYPTVAGLPNWGGACAEQSGQACTLRMDGDKSVSLEGHSSGLLREHRHLGPVQYSDVEAAADGDLLLAGVHLTRLAPSGQVRWSHQSLYARRVRQDAVGNLYVLLHTGALLKFSAQGEELWRRPAPEGRVEGHRGELAVTPQGHVYTALTLGNEFEAARVQLEALDAQGAVRWTRSIDSARVSTVHSLLLGADDSLYVAISEFESDVESGTLRQTRNATPRKYTSSGEQLWEADVSCVLLALDAGPVSCVDNLYTAAPGAHVQRMLSPDGALLWGEERLSGPGLVSGQARLHAGQLVLAGNELMGGQTNRPSWLAAVVPGSHALGPHLQIRAEDATGTNVHDVAINAAGEVVVVGNFEHYPDFGEAFVRVFDPRALTLSLPR